MNILNPFSNQYTAWADVKQCYKTTYKKEQVNNTQEGQNVFDVINPQDTSRRQKFVVVAKTIAILALSLVLFPVGAFVFRSLVNRMALHKEEFTDHNGNKFKGTMKFDKLYQGQLTLTDSRKYEGQFNTQCQLKKGIITYPKNNNAQKDEWVRVSAKGSFVNGNLEGKGTEVFLVNNKTNIIDCSYKNGVPEGKGTHTFNGELIYKGEFSDNSYEGKGKYTVDGNVYVGEFKKSEFHGKGKLTRKDGSKLEGHFENSILREGKITDANGNVHEGTWDEKGENFTPKVQAQN